MGGHRRISARQRFANAVFDLVRLFFQRGPEKIRQPQKCMQSRAHHAHLYALFAALFFVLYRFLSPVLAFVVAVPLFVYTDQVILITTLTYFQKTI